MISIAGSNGKSRAKCERVPYFSFHKIDELAGWRFYGGPEDRRHDHDQSGSVCWGNGSASAEGKAGASSRTPKRLVPPELGRGGVPSELLREDSAGRIGVDEGMNP
jgi:hypothetical protein